MAEHSWTSRAMLSLGVFCAIIGLFAVRPSMLGEVYAGLGSGLVVLSSLVIAASQRLSPRRIQGDDIARMFFLIFLFLYLFSITAFGEGRADFVIKSFVMHLVVAIFAFVLVMVRSGIETFCASFYMVVLSLALSGLITFFSALIGVDALLFVGLLDYNYFRDMELYFPFSTVYHWIWFEGIFLPRQSFMFREAGIAPIFFAFAIIIGEKLRVRLILQLIIIFAVLLTFSTVALPIFAILLIHVFARRLRLKGSKYISVFLVGTLIGGIFLVLAPVVGLFDKQEFAEQSVLYRLLPTIEAWSNWSTLLFGEGFYRELSVDTSLLSAVDSIGLIGFFAFTAFYLMPVLGSRDYLDLVLPSFACVVLVAFFSQPLLDAPFLNFFFLVPFWRLKLEETGQYLRVSERTMYQSRGTGLVSYRR